MNVDPAVIQWVAARLESIGATVADAATGQTTGVAAAASDEVSTAIASVFSQYGEEYQALIKNQILL